MKCPQCEQELTTTEVTTTDNQKALIHECYNCGGHFFPSLIANFIDSSSANNIDSISPKLEKETSPNHQYKCPICNDTLINLQDDSVPQNLNIFTCPENHGHFFPKDQLIAFKKAQAAKLAYHQIWGIPLKSAFAILLPIIAIFTIVGVIPLTVNEIQKRQESRVAASIPISNPIIVPLEDGQYILSFTSKFPAKSSIKLNSKNGNEKMDISTDNKTIHIITLKNLTPKTNYTYKIIITNKENNIFESDDYTINTQ
jgi:hypothetical protein